MNAQLIPAGEIGTGGQSVVQFPSCILGMRLHFTRRRMTFLPPNYLFIAWCFPSIPELRSEVALRNMPRTCSALPGTSWHCCCEPGVPGSLEVLSRPELQEAYRLTMLSAELSKSGREQREVLTAKCNSNSGRATTTTRYYWTPLESYEGFPMRLFRLAC